MLVEMPPRGRTREETSEDEEAGDSSSTILIVDDYPVDRRIAAAIIEKAGGLKAAFATDGRAALEAIERGMPAAVVADLQMPGMDGLALVQEIRERFPRLPVILMTAHGSEDVAIQALRAGAANYVPKKSLVRELGDTIRQVLAASAVDRRRQRVLGAMERRESRFRLESDPALITPLIGLLLEDLGGMNFCDYTARTRVGIALHEALTNALFHGNLEVSSDLRQDDERAFYETAERRRGLEPYRDRQIHVHARFERDEATYTIRDEGPGFDTTTLDRPIEPEDLMKIGGRGMLLIRTFMDEVRHNESGNEVTLIKRNRAPS